MPEGDTIRRLANRLTSKQSGATVERTVFRHPRLVTETLNGSKIIRFDAYGKHLLARFNDGRTLHTHLLMQGQVAAGWPRNIPAWRRQIELKTDRGWIIGLDLSVLDLIPTVEEQKLLGHLGPDICGAYDHERATQRLAAAAHLPLGAALLDQTIVCGLGNIYAVETPYIVGVSPLTPVGNLDRPTAVLSIAVGLIRTNAYFGPQNTTGRRLQTSDHWVLNSRIKRCLKCGNILTRLGSDATAWKRRTAYCSVCQPERVGLVDLNRAARLLSLHPCRKIVDVANGTLIVDTNRPTATRLNPEQSTRRYD